MAGRPLRFGIVGCGTIGPTHARAIASIPGAELVAAADPVEGRGSMLGAIRVYQDQAELLADPGVDAVCLCTPSGMHADGAVAALAAGKHVVIEKPMDVSVPACDRVLAAQQGTGLAVAVVSQHRFDPATIEVKRLVDSGRFGRLILITADVKWFRTQAYYDGGAWRGTRAMDGGGAVMNQGIHTADLLLYLAGPVASVSARAATAAHERIEVEDVAVTAIAFQSGAVGSFVATTAAFDGLPVRIDVFGTDGAASIQGDRLAWTKFKTGGGAAGDGPAPHAVGVAAGGTTAASADVAWGDSHRAQLADFVDAVRSGRPPAVDGFAGRAAVEFVRAIYDAADVCR